MSTALVLDVDGVVCPASGFSPFGELVEVGVALRPIQVPPLLCAALAELAASPDVTPVWLTSWLPRTRRAMRPPFPGAAWEQIEPEPGDGWPKWSALTAWLARHSEITRLAWVDDDLADRAPRYTGDLADRGVDALLITPATDHGMTPDHLTHLRHWLRGS